MRICKRLLMFLPVLALTIPAFAQPGRPGQRSARVRPMEPLMAVLDKNRDGELSNEELKNASRVLKHLDRNGDGQIIRDEIRAFMMSRFGGQPGQRPGGQPGQRPGGSSRAGGGPGTPGSATLERAGLKVGSPVPDVTIYDAEGKELSLNALRGSHAVLVFGCLT